MRSRQQELLTKLEQIKERYARSLPHRLAELETTVADASTDAGDRLEKLQLQLHSLAGSGATLGFPELSRKAHSLQLFVEACVKNDCLMSAEVRREIQVRLVDLRCAANHPAPTTAPAVLQNGPLDVTPTVAVVQDEEGSCSEVVEQLQLYGYEVRQLSSLGSLAEGTPAGALIVDTDAVKLNQLKAQLPQDPPALIVVSSRNDFASRLEAVRQGARAYFVKPLDVFDVIERIDLLSRQPLDDPLRILIVEDQSEVAEHHSLVLQQAGFKVAVVTEPARIAEALVEVRPDLLLMDVYMPGCNGMELAALLRQQDAYVGVPIIYLSAEHVLERQLEAMRLGAEDFLTKSVSPDHLVSIINLRALRGRALRGLIVRDGLTGLLNHSAVQERLDVEIARARRYSQQMSLAMLDLDHFKKINDTYGHAAGDRVLRSLARLLKQRLRKTDVVGRYGGEEFVVILPDTSLEMARKELDAVRETFSRISFNFDGNHAVVTLSGGVAVYPQCATAQELGATADSLLYRAKAAGRNCVLAAENLVTDEGGASPASQLLSGMESK